MIRCRLKLMIGLLGLAALLASAGSANASILIFQSETLALTAHTLIDNGMSSSTADDESQKPVQPDQLRKQPAAPTDGGPGMNSSVGGASGAFSAQALPTSSQVFQKDSLSGRLASEAKLLLPAPFILGLIRPPQLLS